MENLSLDDKYGKRRQVTFRLGPIAQERLEQTSELFHMKPTEYVKALVYKDLGIFNESPDLRRKKQRRKAKRDHSKNSEAPS
jgi:hypothetical protein